MKSGNSLSTYLYKHRWIALSISVVTILRLLFIGLMGLMPQDAYYYFYGQHLALSYFDHPPAIAWLLRGATDLLGRHAFVVKLTDTVITWFTLLAFYRLAQKFLSPHRSCRALLWLYSTLMVTILSLVSTPDVPLLLFWAIALNCLYKALFEEKPQWWIWTGVAMGLAFDSKYTAIFLPFGTVLFLLLSDRHRKQFLSPWPYLAVLFFLLTISPVVIWNVSNQFASFRFQSSQRVGGIELHVMDIFGVIGHQSGILIPVLFFGLCYFIYRSFRKYGLRWRRIPARQLFLLSFFAPLFFGFLIISPIYWVKLNWMMPAYITGIIWVSTWLGTKWLRWQWIISMVIHLALAVEILFYPAPVKSDDTWVGWEDFGKQVAAIQQQYPQDFIFSADDYKTSAILNFYLGRMVYAENIIGRRALQFDFVGTNVQTMKGRNAIFINSLTDVNDDKDEQREINDLRPFFSDITPLPPVVVVQHGRVVRKFLVFRCIGYRPPQQPS
ncbi:glycosyltransferase family 39 protein [Chitinophaga vietnamensis]|uniref:glycosyltransferase family 39 protein n=1 Tax=Chitinophaga vietnamensis TaxID=2593957 RepID=UPI0011788ED4|nr:glycosyltransferase family 39 protein [Chitinophaga vietnamensis]